MMEWLLLSSGTIDTGGRNTMTAITVIGLFVIGAVVSYAAAFLAFARLKKFWAISASLLFMAALCATTAYFVTQNTSIAQFVWAECCLAALLASKARNSTI
jgi:hypothetical protein